MNFEPIDPSSLSSLIKGRRTVKPAAMKKHSQVPDTVIREALENATYAPNHGKTQPWHFVVFSGEALQALNRFQANLYLETAGDSFLDSKFLRMKLQFETVAYSIAIGMKKDMRGNIPEWEEQAAVACAVQNMALTIANRGYGGIWSSGKNLNHPAMKKYVGLSEADLLLGWFLVGEIAIQPPVPPRHPLEMHVIWKVDSND
ncbi:MAG: nitroreductase [Ferruginibacter sp.]|nr:nitroreductase [Ferruginibacter sp.]